MEDIKVVKQKRIQPEVSEENPFILQLDDEPQHILIQRILLTIFLIPLRVLAISILLIFAWLFASLGLYGIEINELNEKPLTGWRKKLKIIVAHCMRGMFFCGSFHNITFKGRRASAKEAPIIVVAPHSSYFDAIVVILLYGPAVVAKAETASLAFFGKLINFTQPIYVWREDQNSRQTTIQNIKDRASSQLDWEQVLIFPEGTCTNRSSLIEFKPGAFYPGVPVQPVLLRYPNTVDTVTWTWQGAGVLKSLWMTLTQLNTKCEIEFLPPYVPNDEEIKNARLYASNVRDYMASELGVPISHYTYSDYKIMTIAENFGNPHAANLIRIKHLQKEYCLNFNEAKQMEDGKTATENALYTMTEFRDFLNSIKPELELTKVENIAHQFFDMFEVKPDDRLDIRELLLCTEYLRIAAEKRPMIDLVQFAAKMYSTEKKDDKVTMDLNNFILTTRYTLGLSYKDSVEIFERIDNEKSSLITYDQLKHFLENRPKSKKLFSTKMY